MEILSLIPQENKRKVVVFQRYVKTVTYYRIIITDCLYTEPSLKYRLCQRKSVKVLASF